MLYRNEKQIGFILHDDKCLDRVMFYDSKVFEQGYIIEEQSMVPVELDDTIGKDLITYRITGNSKTIAVPGENPPIKTIGVGDLVQSGEHTGEYLVEVIVKDNFLNPQTIALNKEIENGQIIDSEGKSVSDFIPINTHLTYAALGILQYALEYDIDKTLIGMITLETVDGVRVYHPSSDARYVKLSLFSTNINTAIFQSHQKGQPFSDFEEPISIKIYLPRQIFKNEWVEFNKQGGIFHQEYLTTPQDVPIPLPVIPTFKDAITPNGAVTILDISTEVVPESFYCIYRSSKNYNPQSLKTSDMETLYSSDGEIIYTRK